MQWFSAYVNTKYEIPQRKQQSTHVDGLVVQAAKKMRLIQGKDDVLLLDGGFFLPNYDHALTPFQDKKQQPGMKYTHFTAYNNQQNYRDAID